MSQIDSRLLSGLTAEMLENGRCDEKQVTTISLKCCNPFDKDLYNIIYNMDWSKWYDSIFNEDIEEVEYGGVLCLTDSGEYIAPILYKGTLNEVFIDIAEEENNDLCSIHSHPICEYDSNCLPSYRDFNVSAVGYVQLVVTQLGVMIYVPFEDVNDKDKEDVFGEYSRNYKKYISDINKIGIVGIRLIPWDDLIY